jgi:hypothetical protein
MSAAAAAAKHPIPTKTTDDKILARGIQSFMVASF